MAGFGGARRRPAEEPEDSQTRSVPVKEDDAAVHSVAQGARPGHRAACTCRRSSAKCGMGRCARQRGGGAACRRCTLSVVGVAANGTTRLRCAAGRGERRNTSSPSGSGRSWSASNDVVRGSLRMIRKRERALTTPQKCSPAVARRVCDRMRVCDARLPATRARPRRSAASPSSFVVGARVEVQHVLAFRRFKSLTTRREAAAVLGEPAARRGIPL